MHINKRINITTAAIATYVLLVCSFVVSCSPLNEETPDRGDISELPYGHNIAIMAGGACSTRTQINPSDMQSVMWSEDDQIALWAMDESTSRFSFEATPLSLYYYGKEYNTAIFTGNTPAQTADSYTYFATYPLPKALSGSSVTLSLPTTQSGYYDGAADLMYARAEGQGALGGDAMKNGSLVFTQLTHAIRVEIPKDRDLLGATSKLQIIFPENVVGDATIDLMDENPSIALTNASNSVYIDFDQVISEAGYVWVFIRPTTIDGAVEFVGYDKDNIPSKSIVKHLSQREMAAGRITPITLTIPEEHYRTVVLTISENNIGEAMKSVTLTAPAGAYFEGDVDKITVQANADGNFEFSYSAARYDAAFRAGEISVSFESDHTIVPRAPIKLTKEDKFLVNYRDYTIPYLYAEDFSSLTETGEHILLHSKPLPSLENYWTNGRLFRYWEGKCIALKPYLLGLTCYYAYISLNLNGKTYLKPNIKVPITVEFNADWKKKHMGWVELQLYDNDDDDNSTIVPLSGMSNVSENYIPTKHVTEYPNFKSTTKMVWQTRQGRDHGTDVYDHVYIDNIKISIK